MLRDCYNDWVTLLIINICRYQNIVSSAEKKKYDVLDHRKAEFESDYIDFKSQIENLQAALQNYMDSWFDRSLSTEYLLGLLKKFECIEGTR